MANRKLNKGDTIWEFTVLDPSRRVAGKTREDGTSRSYAAALVRCSCSTPENPVELVVYQHHLRSGNTKSCGHYGREIARILPRKPRPPRPKRMHLKVRISVNVDPETMEARKTVRRTWSSIKDRCFNPNVKTYRDYGGRGITLWAPWVKDSNAFIDWVLENIGPRPDGRSIDRIDVNGNYEPGNLRWATDSEQMSNTRNQLDPMNGVIPVPDASTFGYLIMRDGEKFRESGFATPEDASEARDTLLGVLEERGRRGARRYIRKIAEDRESVRNDTLESARREAEKARDDAARALEDARSAVREAAALENAARKQAHKDWLTNRARRWRRMNETMTLSEVARAEGVTTATVSAELKRRGFDVVLHNGTGYPGVKEIARNGRVRYEARMVIDGRRRTIGTFKTAEEASDAYQAVKTAETALSRGFSAS